MLRTLTPLIRKLSKLTTIYCVIVFFTAIWPITPYVAAFVILYRRVHKKKSQHTDLGSAAFASESELVCAGILDSSTGLILGPLAQQHTWAYTRMPAVLRQRRWARLSRATHSAIFAPSGAGKTVSIVIPALLTNAESCVVVDLKGELAAATAVHREKRFGHRVVCLDPFRIYTNQPDSLNPLDAIPSNYPLAIDDANDLSAAMVVRTGHETDPHWSESSEAVIAAVTATTIAYGEPQTRSLHTVRDIISNPDKLTVATRLMLESDRWRGALNQMGGQLLSLVDKERASVLSSALRHMRFLGSPAIFESTATSSFDPNELRQGKMTIYLILPPDRAQANAGLLRLWISSLLRTCMRGGLQ